MTFPGLSGVDSQPNQGGRPPRSCRTCKETREEGQGMKPETRSMGWVADEKRQCDRARPTCQRCLRSNRPCGGYELANSQYIFRQENIRLQTGEGPNDIAHESTRFAGVSPTQAVVPRGPVAQPVQLALPFFLNNYIACIDSGFCETSNDFAPFIGRMVHNTVEEDALTLITSALALSVYSHRSKQHVFGQEAQRYYTRAISSLRLTIMDTTLAKNNRTVMAALLFNNWELLNNNSGLKTFGPSHVSGALALIKTQDPSLAIEPVTHVLRKVALDQAVVQAMYRTSNTSLHGQPVFNESVLNWLLVGGLDTKDTTYRFLPRVGFSIARLRGRARNLMQGELSSHDQDQLSHMAKEALRLDDMLVEWSNQLPQSLRYLTFAVDLSKMSAVEQTHFFSPIFDDYLQAGSENLWNQWRVYRIYASMLAVNCLERLVLVEERASDMRLKARLAVLQSMVDGICASVPYVLAYRQRSPKIKQRSSTDFQDAESVILYRKTDLLPLPRWKFLHVLEVASHVMTINQNQRLWLINLNELLWIDHGLNHALKAENTKNTQSQGGIADRVATVLDMAPPKGLLKVVTN